MSRKMCQIQKCFKEAALKDSETFFCSPYFNSSPESFEFMHRAAESP